MATLDSLLFSKGIINAVKSKYGFRYTDEEILSVSNSVCNRTYRRGKTDDFVRALANESWLAICPPKQVSTEQLLLSSCSGGYLLDLYKCLTNINRDITFDKSSYAEYLLSELYEPPKELFEHDGFINYRMQDIDNEMLCICDKYYRCGRYALLASADADEILGMFTHRLTLYGFSNDIRRLCGQNIDSEGAPRQNY